MCGGYTLSSSTEALTDLFKVRMVPELKPRNNIAPTQPVAAVRQPSEGEREIVLLHWGLTPSWAKDPDIGNRLFNARSETVAEKPAFRSAFKHRHCLIPTDGFYEWQRVGERKQPYYIQLLDGGPFAFAGLWEHWEGPENLVIESCTILTTEANALVRSLHNRMPLIIDPSGVDKAGDSAGGREDREVLILGGRIVAVF